MYIPGSRVRGVHHKNLSPQHQRSFHAASCKSGDVAMIEIGFLHCVSACF